MQTADLGVVEPLDFGLLRHHATHVRRQAQVLPAARSTRAIERVNKELGIGTWEWRWTLARASLA